MTELINRRAFCRSLALAGALAPAGGAVMASSNRSAAIENEFFGILFDPSTGRFDILKGQTPLVLGAEVHAETDAGVRSTSEPRFRRSVRTQAIRDGLGTGRRIVARAVDTERRLDFELHLSLYNGLAAVVVEAACRNVSGAAMRLQRLSPLATDHSNGRLHWPVRKILTNGQMYSDPGSMIDLQAVIAPITSWWNLGLFSDYGREGLVCGYLRNQSAQGQVRFDRGDDRLTLSADSTLGPNFVLPAGGEIHSEPFILLIGGDPYQALESYAALMGRLQNARVDSIVNGWCSWFYTFEHVTEEEVLRNAEFAARELKPFGLEYIQVDEGFQRWHGDWEGNERFPHGMKWLADQIRAMGLKPGIWLAPYVISEPTEVFQKHPDWLLRRSDGRLQRVGPWPSEDSDWARSENPRRYGLDITHQEAAAWLADLFDTVANRWGYEMIKIDFVGWSLLAGEHYHDPTVTPAVAYRRGFEIMRRAAGPRCHIQECGPAPVTVGLADSMRIELDQNYGFRRNTWSQYVAGSSGSAAAMAKRYYFHKRTWINDADHICLNLLSRSQAQAAATLIALSGGNIISGDRLIDLDAERMAILKKAFPSTGEAARPVDLLDDDPAKVFAVKIRRPFGEWTVAAFFNADENAVMRKSLPMERLWLDPRTRYVAYDFWQERLHGVVQGELSVMVPPAGVTLLALHEYPDRPLVVSCDRHILQGAVELEEVRWDEAEQTLFGVSRGAVGSAHNLAVYLPKPQPWTQGGKFLHRDFGAYTLKMMDEHILRLHVRFEAEKIPWKIDLAAFQ